MANGVEPAADLINALIRGGEAAFESFRRLSGGYWLNHAPEYFLTSYAAAAIGDTQKTTAGIEVSVAATRAQALAVPRGRPHGEDRRTGRYDIVLYWANGNPRAGVEVKSRLWWADPVRLRSDFVRLCKTLAARPDSTFQFCVFLYFVSVDDPKRDYPNASQRLRAVIEGIGDSAERVADEHGLAALTISGRAHRGGEDPGAWAIAALVFVRPSAARPFI